MKHRNQLGSALSEFGPAVFLIFVCGLLPIVDGLFIATDYGCLLYLNELQLREAQKLPRSEVLQVDGSVTTRIPEKWRTSLLGGMTNPLKLIQTNVEYKPVPWQPVGSNQTVDFWFVAVTTTVSFRPAFVIPFMNFAPGLGAPLTLSVSGRRPVENNRFLNQ